MSDSADPIKVYDARWEVGEFSDEQIRRLFEASLLYARELGVDTITLTRDARLGCAEVMRIGLEVARSAGFRIVVCLSPISTPQSYFTTLWTSRTHPKTMGLTITASHNPAQYVGIKFTIPTVHAIGLECGPSGGLSRIRELYHSVQQLEQREGGEIIVSDLTREYIDFSLQQAGIKSGALKGLSVVLDTFNGSAGAELYQAMTLAGVSVEPMRLIPDGNFPTGSPNPTSQGKMADAVALAKHRNCDAVLGIDGDGDRIVFGDRRGILTAGFAFIPILQTCLETQWGKADPAPVLYDPKVSPKALEQWSNLGAQPVLFRNGHSQIKDYMSQIGALAAAEESGHYYHRITLDQMTISGENSILTVLLFLGALKKDRNLLDRLWAMQDKIFTTGEFNYQFESDQKRDEALSAVISHFARDGAVCVTATADGIDLQGTCLNKGVWLDPGNIKLDDGWYSGYLRIATNEKAVARSYFSTGDHELGATLEKQARSIMQKQFNGKTIE